MTEIESVVKPDCIADDFRRKAVTFVYIHTTILAASRLNLAIPTKVTGKDITILWVALTAYVKIALFAL
jgi:hypothetical protein